MKERKKRLTPVIQRNVYPQIKLMHWYLRGVSICQPGLHGCEFNLPSVAFTKVTVEVTFIMHI